MGDGKTQFYTPSGNYNVSFEVIDAPFVTPPGGTTQIFRVLANPHGPSFAEVGSAVTGCYNPVDATSEVVEYRSNEKGEQDYRSC